MIPITDKDVDSFWNHGYILFRSVFSTEEVRSIRAAAYRNYEEDLARGVVDTSGRSHCPKGDLLSKPHLRGVLLDPRVVGAARRLLGADPVYFGDSNFQLRSGALGWHKDSRMEDRYNPRALDWQGRYPIIRFGLYLQDHSRHSGGLSLRVGSHEVASDRTGKAILIDSEVGDLVAWNLRTTHSGNSVRLKWLPRIKLDPWIEDRVPLRFRVPEQAERVAMFLSFGAEGPHLSRYIEYFKTRDYGAEYLRSSRFGPEVWEQAESAGLKMVRPIPEYGSSNCESEEDAFDTRGTHSGQHH